MIRRLCVSVLLLVGLGIGTPASAVDSPLSLSWDGSTWASALTGSLFESAGTPRLWVPGDADSARFLVSNRTADDAALLVDYRLGRAPHLVPDMRVSARVGSGPWQPLVGGRGWLRLVRSRSALAGGDETTVTVRAVFAPSAGNPTQDRRVPLRFRVTLSQVGVGPGPADAQPGGLLPNTGSEVSPWMIAATALCLGAGLALIVGARRRDRDE